MLVFTSPYKCYLPLPGYGCVIDIKMLAYWLCLCEMSKWLHIFRTVEINGSNLITSLFIGSCVGNMPLNISMPIDSFVFSFPRLRRACSVIYVRQIPSEKCGSVFWWSCFLICFVFLFLKNLRQKDELMTMKQLRKCWMTCRWSRNSNSGVILCNLSSLRMFSPYT